MEENTTIEEMPYAPNGLHQESDLQQVTEQPVTEVTPQLADAAEIERLIAEAEERGYRRGRQEGMSELMELPQPDDAADEAGPDDAEILILAHRRPSIWD